MTQIVLMLYEDPKADPLSDNRFHVELHFSPGAKTMDDPEFLTRSSPTRKRSEEDVRISSAASVPTAEIVNAKNKVVVDGSRQSQDSALNAKTSIPRTSPGNSQTAERVEFVVNDADKSSVGSSQDVVHHSTEEEPLESGDFEPYDDTVYAGNERPRFSIGMEDYSDSAMGASTGDSTVSSGISIEESSGEEKPLTRQRNSLSETELSNVDNGINRRCKSDSEVFTLATKIRTSPRRKMKDQEASPVKCIVEEDSSQPYVRSPRRKAHSVGGSPDDLCISKLTEGMLTL